METRRIELRPSSVVRFAGSGAQLGMFISLGYFIFQLLFGSEEKYGHHVESMRLELYLQSIIVGAFAGVLLMAIGVAVRDRRGPCAGLIRFGVKTTLTLAYLAACIGWALLVCGYIFVQIAH